MSECAFFDDQPPPDGLPRWATITQVSAMLTVPRTTIRGTVRRALCYNEPWVKRENALDEHSPYLIDTTHETYISHAHRWKLNQEGQTTLEEQDHPQAPQPDQLLSPHIQQGKRASYAPFSRFPWMHFDTILFRWPLFRERLHTWGIQIFQNVLAADEAPDALWQWRWGDLHGEGYFSIEEAVIAALESRIDLPAKAAPASSLSSPSASEAPAVALPQPSGPTGWFAKFQRSSF